MGKRKSRKSRTSRGIVGKPHAGNGSRDGMTRLLNQFKAFLAGKNTKAFGLVGNFKQFDKAGNLKQPTVLNVTNDELGKFNKKASKKNRK